MDNPRAQIIRVSKAIKLSFVRTASPRFLVGFGWAIMLHQSIYFAGVQATGWCERAFKQPHIFPLTAGGIVFAALWILAACKYLTRFKPRLNEWSMTFALSLGFWAIVVLGNSCDDSPSLVEWSYFAMAMFVSSLSILLIPVILNIYGICRRSYK